MTWLKKKIAGEWTPYRTYDELYHALGPEHPGRMRGVSRYTNRRVEFGKEERTRTSSHIDCVPKYQVRYLTLILSLVKVPQTLMPKLVKFGSLFTD